MVLDHYPDLRGKMEAELVGWIKAGQLTYRDEEVDGLERAMTAVNRLYEGTNMGKLLVKIADQI